MFETLREFQRRPRPYERLTTALLWTDEHVSRKMLEFHLDAKSDIASRNHALIEKSVDWMAERFRLGPGSKVCDFGCGPGLYANRLAQKGAQVTGVDFSPRSIGHARGVAARQGLQVSYVCQDYLEFQSRQRFDLIAMIFCDFCALGPEQRRLMLAKFRDLLAPGGALLLDVFSPRLLAGMGEKCGYKYFPQGGFWAAGEHHVFRKACKYEAEMIFLDRYLILEEGRTREIFNWLQCFSPESLAGELAENGLAVAERYANVAGQAYDPAASEFAVVAQCRS
ncbi:hypothetical protein AAU61_01820 [Desulfocarbo indianensis]|nr:hypothetical protein AAU61_01820 [Desulfocarbo indianensis]